MSTTSHATLAEFAQEVLAALAAHTETYSDGYNETTGEQREMLEFHRWAMDFAQREGLLENGKTIEGDNCLAVASIAPDPLRAAAPDLPASLTTLRLTNYGYGFPTAFAAAKWLDDNDTQKAIWENTGGDVWIGDNPGEGWRELSRRELFTSAFPTK